MKCCRLVLDKASQQPKGTAFVEFWEASCASSAAAACQQARSAFSPELLLSESCTYIMLVCLLARILCCAQA